MGEMSAKERLLASAARLFYQYGFHATGIEKILTDANVSKMTLYRHFGSKDELIVAVMKDFHRRFKAWLTTSVETSGSDPVGRLEAIFESLNDLLTNKAFGDSEFRGCPFVKAASEFGDMENPVHRIAADHKRWLMDYIAELVNAAPVSNPDDLAVALFLEFEGAYVTALVTGDSRIGGQVQKLAKHTIELSLSR
jgi:AcrR family transcriptional regulator